LKKAPPVPSPPPKIAPQIVVPTPSSEIQMKVQKQQQKKQQSYPQPQPQSQPQQNRQPSQQTAEKPTKPTKPPVDYQVLLLSLADEYLNAAHNFGTKAALATREADVEEYYKLVATGLGCLEAVLKVRRRSSRGRLWLTDISQNWRLQPRKEALVRLRYARTLFEETDNDIEAETALSKGVCFDLFFLAAVINMLTRGIDRSL
jgi:hypothetical protein